MIASELSNRGLAGWIVAFGLLVLPALPACQSSSFGADAYQRREQRVETQTQLGGEALSQKKILMRRTHRDMVHLHATARSLRRHRDQLGMETLEGFLRPYLEQQLDPLLSRKAESWHPELRTLDANLLFAKAALLVELRDRRGVDRVMLEIQGRFEGMENMLVEYPMGSSGTLEQGMWKLIADQAKL